MADAHQGPDLSATATRGERSAPRDSAVDQITTERSAKQPVTKRPQVSCPVIGALVALMVVSSVAHLWALRRDLPVPDIDEPFFVGPAVQLAATGDPNPDWFGHPGSTVIYPLGGLFHIWDAIAHHGPILTSNPELTARFQRSPSEFYVIGRLWTIALSVGALPLLFLVGRRAFNTRIALVATAIYAVLPLPVQLGRIVRSDSAAAFFGLLALWLCLRLLDEPRIRWCVLAGLGVGLAVSSRYFMVALVPVLVAAAVLPNRRALRTAVRWGGVALASAVGGFALSTPYFFLDWHTALDNLRAERAGPVRDFSPTGLSYVGNLRWYVGTAIPEALTWPLVALAAAGVMVILWRRRADRLLPVAFCAIFLAGICASDAHWSRWISPILPFLVLLAAAAADIITQRAASLTTRRLRIPMFAPVALVAVTAVLVLPVFSELLSTNREDSESASISAATRSAARDWIVAHVPPGSRILGDAETLPVHSARFDVDNRFNPRTHTVGDYRNAGYQYLVVNGRDVGIYRFSSAHHPREARFYMDVACHTRLIAIFPRTFLELRGKWPIRIYQLDQPPRTTRGFLCSQQVDS
jgi:hypothetical protein